MSIDSSAKGSSSSPEQLSAYSTMVIALYNVGVECEFLGRLREALASYQKA